MSIDTDLGATYLKDRTVFRVWSPKAEMIKVVIYDKFYELHGNQYEMVKADNEIWELNLSGDYANKYYNYRVTIDGIEKETPDPYTKGASINGEKGMIIDFGQLNPAGWEKHPRPAPIKPVQAIIYEIHVRDFSMDANSGILHKGKYLGFTEEDTYGSGGQSTGLRHLKELGVTHVHLMPVSDFSEVDERKNASYNWGYNPYLYNVPEGSYSTDPFDGTVRIIEFKKMIQKLHVNGLRVVMDVVYNHTFHSENSPFNILAPKYYYRLNEEGEYSNGSGCGNELASEKPAVRKFIIDSLKFWAEEYKIDGFRFDLMGLMDIETAVEIERQLKEINPDLLLYGEPWAADISVLDGERRFGKGKQKGMKLGLFNDDFRNALKGDNDGLGPGFVTGGTGLETAVKTGAAGSICYSDDICGFALEPCETINYASSHDNLTLYDKINKACPDVSEQERESMNRLALSILLTSQGCAFIHGGSEILRSKRGHSNSYNAGDGINKIDWESKCRYLETFRYISGLIDIRSNQKVMTLEKSEDIKMYLVFTGSPPNTVAYLLNSPFEGDYKHIFVVHNANRGEVMVDLPLKGPWIQLADGREANLSGLNKKPVIEQIMADPLSTCILAIE